MATLKRSGIAIAVIFGLVLSTGLLSAIGDTGSLGNGNRAAADTTSTEHTITVDGEGSVSAKPDTAHVTLGVQIQDPQLAAAQSQATDKMNAVLSALKQDGINDKDIKTVNYSVSVMTDQKQPGTSEVTGYMVTNLVDVKISQIDKVGSIIDDAVSAGANTVNGIQFTIENMDALVQQARQMAMQNAHDKAQQLAKLGGVTLGMPVSITENSSTPPPPFSTGARDIAGAGAVPIQSGESVIMVSVSVSYGF